jgi:hypothetical protein
MHQKQRVTTTINGQERTRIEVTCREGGLPFVITRDGQTCPTCGQMFNLVGQAITHKGY